MSDESGKYGLLNPLFDFDKSINSVILSSSWCLVTRQFYMMLHLYQKQTQIYGDAQSFLVTMHNFSVTPCTIFWWCCTILDNISKVKIGLNSLTVSGLSGIRQLRWICQKKSVRPFWTTRPARTFRAFRASVLKSSCMWTMVAGCKGGTLVVVLPGKLEDWSWLVISKYYVGSR